MKGRWIFWGARWGLLFIAGMFLMGAVIMLLWNALVPVLFHGPVLSYWQALGLFVLSRLLLRGGRWRGHWSHRWKGHYHWRQRMNEKVAAMTPEEREKFMQQMRYRCGHWYRGAEEKAEPSAQAS